MFRPHRDRFLGDDLLLDALRPGLFPVLCERLLNVCHFGLGRRPLIRKKHRRDVS